MCILEEIELFHKVKSAPGFRFILEVDGDDAFVVKLSSRPKMIKKSAYSPSMWEPTTIILADPISPNSAQRFIGWLESATCQFEKKNFILKMLNGSGDLVEKWEAIGAIPLNVIWYSPTVYQDESPFVTFDVITDKWNLLFLK